MDKFLTDCVCLVTGGAQGIGWAISQALADHGGQVYACDISDENLARATHELESLPWADRITLTRCDVAKRAEIEGWIAEIHRQTGRIDVLVNNAAFVRWEDVMEMSVEDAVRTMEVGYNGMVYGIKSVLPLMQAAGRGHIVNMGSSAGRVLVGSASAAYAAVKAAIDGYTQTLQVELRGSPVHATLVRPATVAGTDFFRKHVPSSRMPRLGDFVPYVTPPQVALSIVRAIRTWRAIVDIPRYLHLFYFFFAVAPGMFRRLITIGGSGQRDYGQVQWRYVPQGGR
jgi:NAD(P)-dependent dehydrogenase (short-subunit alcohol dehydrogenase family)